MRLLSSSTGGGTLGAPEAPPAETAPVEPVFPAPRRIVHESATCASPMAAPPPPSLAADADVTIQRLDPDACAAGALAKPQLSPRRVFVRAFRLRAEAVADLSIEGRHVELARRLAHEIEADVA